MRTTVTQNRHVVIFVLAVAGLLLIPAGAMVFTDSAAWTAFDFITATVLLLGTGLIFELISRRTGNTTVRNVTGVVLVGLVLLVWAQGAVGIFN